MTIATNHSPYDPSTRGGVEVKDFSAHGSPVMFRIDDDIFEAPKQIPAQVMLDFVFEFNSMGEAPTPDDQLKAMMGMIDMILKPESAALFKRRMSDKERPIDLTQIQDIIPWLMEQYGMRPTEPSDSSSDGQPDPVPGTSSTATSPGSESISVSSPPTDSSTWSTTP